MYIKESNFKSMKTLRELTLSKHKEAENMIFNVKMLNGQLTKEEYAKYLISQLEIFTAIEENFKLPNNRLLRTEAVMKDLKALGVYQLELPTNTSLDYGMYLRNLDKDKAMAHVYLNYLAIVYGGQMMKNQTPGPGHMYEFKDMMECAKSIREIQRDDWADEVNKGFGFVIQIFKELEECLITN